MSKPTPPRLDYGEGTPCHYHTIELQPDGHSHDITLPAQLLMTDGDSVLIRREVDGRIFWIKSANIIR